MSREETIALAAFLVGMAAAYALQAWIAWRDDHPPPPEPPDDSGLPLPFQE